MKIIIQKFGGTSVSTIQKREIIAAKVMAACEKGYVPVVVASAIGRKGDPYATDTLLSLINNDNKIASKREMDLLLSCGEIISSVVLSETFERKGIRSIVLTGGQAGIITDSCFGNANLKRVNTARLLEILNNGIVPIVTGFQGMNEEMDFTTLGRGASDVTAAILGEALNAEVIEIYTDVDGIMTADPRIVKDAKMIDIISYNEVFQFADQGAKVIHPRAIEFAMRGNIPILIKNTMSDSKGTLITSSTIGNSGIVTGIAHMPNRTQVSIHFDSDMDTEDNNEIFEILALNKISIDLINVFPNYKVFTIDSIETEFVKRLLDENNYNYKIIEKCSKIAVISNAMKGTPGVMSKILRMLNDQNIKVLQTADSHTTIWCLVREEDTEKAINTLHAIFNS